MPTVIDSLIVQLGLDSKDVDSKAPGVRKHLQDIEKSADKSEQSAKGLSKGLREAGASLTSFLAIVGGAAAIRAFIRDTTDANTQLNFLSQNLGITARSLFAFGAAGQQIGIGKGAIQSLAASLREIPGQLENGQQPALLKLLARAGVSLGSSPKSQMEGLAQFFSTMPKNVATGLGTSSGLSFDQMSFLLQGPQRVAHDLAQTALWSPSKGQVQEFTELKRQIVDLGLQWTKVGYNILSVATPAIEAVLGFLRDIGNWAQNNPKIVTIIAAIAGSLAAIGALAGALGAVSLAFDGLMAAMSALNPVVLLIAALAAAIGLLWNDYQVWSEGGKSTFDWGWFAKGVRDAADAFEMLRKNIVGAYEAYFGGHMSSLSKNHSGPSASENQLGVGIATAEGFFAKGKTKNIPQRANNPGDIEYGPLAKEYGATGYITAAHGAKIAVFPSIAAGWKALYARTGEMKHPDTQLRHDLSVYTGLHGAALSQYMHNMGPMFNGIPSASANATLAAGSVHHTSNSTDNSTHTSVGTVHIHSNAANGVATPTAARGMDWTTLVGQSNMGYI